MANVALKSIKFPGLADTYTVPQVDNTLTQTGRSADAKRTGDELAAINTDITDLKADFLQLECTTNDWGPGVLTTSGNDYTSSIGIRKNGWLMPEIYKSVKVETGYKLYVGAYNKVTGAFAGFYGPNGALSNTKSYFTEFEFPDTYMYRVGIYNDAETSITVAAATNVTFTLYNVDERLTDLEEIKVPLATGKNLVNPASKYVLSGKYVAYNTGYAYANSDFSTVMLPVTGGAVISTAGTANAHIAFFDTVFPTFSGLTTGYKLPGYISGVSGNLTNYTVPANAKCMTVAVPARRIGSSLIVAYSSTTPTYEPYAEGIHYSTILDPPDYVETVEYNIYADGSGDFSNLLACFNAITDASATKQYIVNVYPGTYEIGALYDDYTVRGLTIPNYVTLRGIGDKHNVILDATIESASSAFSTLNFGDVCGLENLTVKSKNCRYTIHDDFQSARNVINKRKIKDCIFVGENCYYGSVYGAGLKGNATWDFENCEFDASKAAANGTPGNAFSVHNNTNVNTPSFITFKNCRLLNGSASYKTFRLLSMTTGSENGTVDVVLEGNKVDGIDIRENDASSYGAGCSFYVSGFANVNTLGVSVASTDGIDYTNRVDLI